MSSHTAVRPTATAVAASVRARPEAAVAVVESCLERIERLDPLLGAFQVVCADAARAEATALPRRDTSELPLAGVPIAIKDNIDVRGLPTRNGSGASAGTPAAEDDELVRRLREAGAVIVGKTRMPELAAWSFTEGRAYGGTANPWDVTRNAGGSTGGGAAAVAAGLVPVAVGSDGGGSLRIPAANCGVVGYKPARGSVPLAGGLADHWFGCTVFGPITADVEDATLVTAVLGDRPVELAPVVTRPLRVAVSLKSPSPLGRPGATAKAGVNRAVELLAAAGHTVERAEPPYPMTLINDWCRTWLAGIAVDAQAYDEEQLEPRTRAMVRRGRRLIRRGRPTPEAATRWTARADAWFENIDVLALPTVARRAPALGAMRSAGYGRSYLVAASGTPYTEAWNLAGYPAISLPMGLGDDGLPLSVQLVAPPGREATLLGVARQLELARGPMPSPTLA
jgi:amidase